MKETNEQKMLKQLAIAMTENPRRTTKDLAEAVGISKATLHRFCGTRENLERMIIEKSKEVMDQIIVVCEIKYENYLEGIKELIRIHWENKEFLTFSCGLICGSSENDYWIPYIKALDQFFINGQKAGVLKIELSAAMLSEVFVAVFAAFVDSERRGRIPLDGIEELFELFLLYGASEGTGKREI